MTPELQTWLVPAVGVATFLLAVLTGRILASWTRPSRKTSDTELSGSRNSPDLDLVADIEAQWK
jgi:hypothetical protein